MSQPPLRKQIVVDVNEFIRTRDALGSAYLGLSASIDKAVKAYLDHTNVILAGDGALDISYLSQPFVQLAQTAQEALLQGSVGAYGSFASLNGAANGEADAILDKRRKRSYKKRDPNAPKRPQTAYFRYLNENRPLFAAELAETSPAGTQRPGDITKHATEKWHRLTKDEQQPYREAYQRELKEYDLAVLKYKAEGGDPAALIEPPSVDAMSIPLATNPIAVLSMAAGDADEVHAAASSSSEEDSSDSSSESEDEPPPPPPPKTPSGKSKPSAKKAAKEVAAKLPTPPPFEATPSAAPAKAAATPSRKRKSAPAANAESSEPKRSRTTAKTEPATPVTKEKEQEKAKEGDKENEKEKKEKKKRKSKVAKTEA